MRHSLASTELASDSKRPTETTERRFRARLATLLGGRPLTESRICLFEISGSPRKMRTAINASPTRGAPYVCVASFPCRCRRIQSCAKRQQNCLFVSLTPLNRFCRVFLGCQDRNANRSRRTWHRCAHLTVDSVAFSIAAAAKLDPRAEQHHMPQHPLPIRLAPHHEPAVAPRSECQRLRDSDELGFHWRTRGRFAWHTPFMSLYPALGKPFRRNVPPGNRFRARFPLA